MRRSAAATAPRPLHRAGGPGSIPPVTTRQIIVLTLFLACYVYLCVGRRFKSAVVWAGAFAFLAVGFITPRAALASLNWNVLGTFAGTFVVAQLFAGSGVPLLLARGLVARSHSVGMAIVLVCLLGGFVSAWVDNVATLLIVAPVAFVMAEHLGADPAPFLIGVAVSSNLQGSATLIGDAPSMILAGYSDMGFNDFFWMLGRPGLFFAVQVGALASAIVLLSLFRRYRQDPGTLPPARVTGWVPTILLGAIILVLAVLNILRVPFAYKNGVTCLVASTAGLAWYYARRGRREGIRGAWRHLLGKLPGFPWDTLLLLAGLFVLVGTLSEVGLIDAIAQGIHALTGGSLFLTFLALVWISVILSGFIDNIPYVTALVPVVLSLGAAMELSRTQVDLLLFGLLIGATVGGNLTPIGASANVVAMGMLERRGHRVQFGRFMRIGVPFTVVATLAATAFVWLFWR
jgi:Na+/H+ antiporter NhaD/arsenite permease-like protein